MIHSIQTKVLLAIICITLLIASAITITFYFQSSRTVEDNYGRNMYSRVEQMGSMFDNAMIEVYYIMIQASCDSSLQKQIEEYEEQGEDKILENMASTLKDYSKNNPDISSIYLVLPHKQLLITSQDYPIYKKNIQTEKIRMIKEASQSEISLKMIADPLRSPSEFLTFCTAVVDDNGRAIAYLMVNMEERAIYYKYLDSLYDGKITEALILNEKNQIISTEESEEVGKHYQQNGIQLPQNNGIINKYQNAFLGAYYQTTFTGFRYFISAEKSVILSDLNQLKYSLALILLLATAFSVIPAYLITRTMFQPIRNLMKTMEEISDGDLNQRVEVTTRDEIGILSEQFNTMLDQINHLIEQVINEQMLKKDAELEALQYQITPHFMYNTLNSIKYAALIRGEKDLGGLIADFVELLQASINKMGTFVTVADELHLLKNYIHLQEFRYEGNFVVEYEVDPAASGCFLPRLLLQPLVENSFLHGLDLKNTDSRIIIRAKVKEDVLMLCVEDNGRGMTEEQIEKLLNKKEKKISGLSGIGVANIRDRLALYYGRKGQLIYKSGNEGTVAQIFLPAYRDQNEYSLG